MRKVITIAVAFTLILITFASMFNINVTAEDGLIAKWSFDEGAGTDATDTSGNGNDGIIYGATWATGINGSALSFDGVDDYVEVPDDPSLRGFNQITLEAWVNIKSVYIYDEGEDIVGKGDDLTKDVYNLHVREDPAQNSLEFKITIGDGVNRATVASSYVFETNTNYSVVGTYDGNILSIYVNGILINDLEVSIQTFGNNLNPLYIGKHTWGASESKRIEGMIDEVKIYNYALSATEIESNYQNALDVANDFAADSYIHITSGTFSELSYNSVDKSIEVQPGTSISGSVDISLDNTGPGSAVYVIGTTPNWGTHSTSYWEIGTFATGTGTDTVDIDVTAPDIEGTYYLIIAGGWEFNAGQVMSATNWGIGTLQWDDGNDVAGWSSTQINDARVDGLAIGQVDTTGGRGNYYFPADAVKITVSSSAIVSPTAPLNLQATPGDGEVTLTWDAPADDGGSSITNYNIYQGTSSGDESYLTTIDNVLTYTDSGLTSWQTYYYQISAVNDIGEGSLSNEASSSTISYDLSSDIASLYSSVDLSIEEVTEEGSGLMSNLSIALTDKTNDFKVDVLLGSFMAYFNVQTIDANTLAPLTVELLTEEILSELCSEIVKWTTEEIKESDFLSLPDEEIRTVTKDYLNEGEAFYDFTVKNGIYYDRNQRVTLNDIKNYIYSSIDNIETLIDSEELNKNEATLIQEFIYGIQAELTTVCTTPVVIFNDPANGIEDFNSYNLALTEMLLNEEYFEKRMASLTWMASMGGLILTISGVGTGLGIPLLLGGAGVGASIGCDISFMTIYASMLVISNLMINSMLAQVAEIIHQAYSGVEDILAGNDINYFEITEYTQNSDLSLGEALNPTLTVNNADSKSATYDFIFILSDPITGHVYQTVASTKTIKPGMGQTISFNSLDNLAVPPLRNYKVEILGKNQDKAFIMSSYIEDSVYFCKSPSILTIVDPFWIPWTVIFPGLITAEVQVTNLENYAFDHIYCDVQLSFDGYLWAPFNINSNPIFETLLPNQIYKYREGLEGFGIITGCKVSVNIYINGYLIEQIVKTASLNPFGCSQASVECPVNLMCTNEEGKRIGTTPLGEEINEIEGAEIISTGEKELYLLPKNHNWKFSVTSLDSGDYTFSYLTLTNVSDYNVFQLNKSIISKGTVDIIEINDGGAKIQLTSEEESEFSVQYTLNRTYYESEKKMSLNEINITGGEIYQFEFSEYNNTSSDIEKSLKVILSIDNDGDGTIDASAELEDGMTGDEISVLIRADSEIDTPIPTDTEINTRLSDTHIGIMVFLVAVVIMIGLSYSEKRPPNTRKVQKRGQRPPPET